MSLKTIASATCIALGTATSSYAVILDFDFSFVDGANTIEGTIFGLENNATSATTGAVITSSPYGMITFDFSDPGISIPVNSFTVTAGEITSYDFDFGIGNFGLELKVIFVGAEAFLQNTTGTPPSFEGTPTFTAVAPVPLPASVLLSGLGGLAALKRRKTRAELCTA